MVKMCWSMILFLAISFASCKNEKASGSINKSVAENERKKYTYGFTDKKIRKAYKKEQKAKRKKFEDKNAYAHSRKAK